MREILGLITAALFLWSWPIQPAAAACQPIDNPTADYTLKMGTERCSLGTTLFANINACKDPDGNTEVKFSNLLSVRHASVSGWATWSSPPFSESSTPWVGFNQTPTLTVTFVDGYQASTAGVEIEPNNFNVYPITVVFRDLANTPLLTITRNVDGRSGARLFAATCDEELINSMVITIPATADGFAIGHIRSDSFVINNDPSVMADEAQNPIQGPDSATSNARIP